MGKIEIPQIMWIELDKCVVQAYVESHIRCLLGELGPISDSKPNYNLTSPFEV